MPDLPTQDASQCYYLDSHLLNYLALANGQRTIEVPISLDIENRVSENGITPYQTILKQTEDVLSMQNSLDRCTSGYQSLRR